jgi:hypothetical protein
MKMTRNRLARNILPAAAVLFCLPGIAFAGAWSLAGVPASGPFGGGVMSPVVQVQFAGDGTTTDAQTSISIPAGFTAVEAAANAGGCAVGGGGTFINVTSSTGSVIPAGPTTFCNVTFTVQAATAAGNYNIVAPAGGAALPTACFDGGGNPFATCTDIANGANALQVVTITPEYTSAPTAPGGTITILDGIGGGATTATLTVTNTGDATTTLNVGAATGLSGVLSIAPATAQAIAQGSAGTAYTISCAATVDAADTQTLSFTHNGSNIASPATYTVVCDGQLGPTAPTASLGAVVQPPVGPTNTVGTGSVPVNIDSAGFPTASLALSCSIPATGASAFTITGGATRTINAPATVGPSTPDIGVSCVRQLAAVSATLTCTQNATPDPDPAALTATVTCPAGVPSAIAAVNPASIAIVGAPAVTATGTTTLSNTGDAALTVASCVVPTGFTLDAPAIPATVAAGGNTAVTVSCTTPAAGAAPLVGDLVCQSNASNGGGVITIPLSCSGTPLVVPVMSNMGKILLASLVIGLGLLGMGLRRQG